MQMFLLYCKIFTYCPYTFRVGEPLSLWSLILPQKKFPLKNFPFTIFQFTLGQCFRKTGSPLWQLFLVQIEVSMCCGLQIHICKCSILKLHCLNVRTLKFSQIHIRNRPPLNTIHVIDIIVMDFTNISENKLALTTLIIFNISFWFFSDSVAFSIEKYSFHRNTSFDWVWLAFTFPTNGPINPKLQYLLTTPSI